MDVGGHPSARNVEAYLDSALPPWLRLLNEGSPNLYAARPHMLSEHGIIIDRRCRRPVTPWSPTFASRSENLSRNFAGSCIRICLKWRPTSPSSHLVRWAIQKRLPFAHWNRYAATRKRLK